MQLPLRICELSQHNSEVLKSLYFQRGPQLMLSFANVTVNVSGDTDALVLWSAKMKKQVFEVDLRSMFASGVASPQSLRSVGACGAAGSPGVCTGKATGPPNTGN